MQLARWYCKQPPWLFSALHRLPGSHVGHIRRLSVPAFSSQTAKHSSDGNAESSRISDKKKQVAAKGHAAARSKKLLGGKHPGSPLKRIITTLDPKRLDSGCFMDFSGCKEPSVHISFPDQDGTESFRLIYNTERRYHEGRYQCPYRPFPVGIRGFLYHHADQRDPLHLQIRFRVTEDSDPATFSRGHDLVYDKGYVWSLRVASFDSQPSRARGLLRRLLVHDGFIDETLVPDSRNPDTPRRGRLRRPIGTLEEPFVFDVSLRYLRMAVFVAGRLHRIQLAPPYMVYVRSYPTSFYDEGSTLCRFERSTLPEHAGKRAVVMRLLKILNPPKLVHNPPRGDSITFPAEGELFRRRDGAWHVDLNKDTEAARVLRLLYDAGDGQDPDSHSR